MKCLRKFHGTHVSMTKQSGDFQRLIITTTITRNKTNRNTVSSLRMAVKFIYRMIVLFIGQFFVTQWQSVRLPILSFFFFFRRTQIFIYFSFLALLTKNKKPLTALFEYLTTVHRSGGGQWWIFIIIKLNKQRTWHISVSVSFLHRE